MGKDKNRAVAAVFLVFISFVFIAVNFPFNVASAPKAEKTWNCASGFSCGSNMMDLCTSTLKPYLSMFNNQHSFSLAVDKPGVYIGGVGDE
jgi:hypothetical protein